MTDSKKIARIARLALYCVANIACYRAGWDNTSNPKKLRNNGDFWARANGNFLDVATLNWCILFVDPKEKHYWQRAFVTKDNLVNDLFSHMVMTEGEFNSAVLEIKRYRDKFLAHLDNPQEDILYYPETEFMLKSAKYLFEVLKSNEQTKRALIGVFINADNYYNDKYEEVRKNKTFHFGHFQKEVNLRSNYKHRISIINGV
jgi:hypothetical protein